MHQQTTTPAKAHRRSCLAAVGLVLFGFAVTAPPPSMAKPIAHAAPVSGITIDGLLNDWPSEMAAYPINRVFEGPHAMWGKPPDGPADFTGRFHVGYDHAAGRLHIAIVVEDDEAGWMGNQLDACFISMILSGSHVPESNQSSATRCFLLAEPSARPQIMPTGGTIPGLDGASRRLGTTTVYEWSLPLVAAWGDSVGLQLSVIDADGGERGVYVSWGDADSHEPGILVLVPVLARKDTSHRATVDPWIDGDTGVRLSGTVRGPGGEPLAGVALAVRGDGSVAAIARTDTAGGFAVEVLPRDYSIEIVPGHGFEAGKPAPVALVADMDIELEAEPLWMPDELRQTAQRYGRLTSYRDTTNRRDETRRGIMESGGTRQSTLAFERPNRIRLTATNGTRGQVVVVSDGDSLTALSDGNGGMQYLRREAPQGLFAVTWTAISAGATVDGLVFRLLFAKDPLSVLTLGTSQIRQLGEDRLDGAATWVFELERFRSFGPGPGSGDVAGDTFVERLWVGQEDHMIRQVVIEEEVAEDQMARVAAGTRRRSWRHMAIRVDEEVAAATFTLDVPERAQLVERFGSP